MSFNAGSIVATLKANIDGFKQDLDKAVDNAKGYSTKITKSFSGLNSSIEKHKQAIQGVAIKMGVIGAAAGVFTKQIVDLASDQNEVISKTEAIFGKSADGIMQKSKMAAKTVGDSKTAYLDMASAVGNLIVPMGFAQDEAADMSDKMVRLAADLGSFNNAPTAEVLEAIKAGLVGSSEPLRRFGIQLSVARIEEEALASGLIKHKDEMNNLIKAQATMNIIMKDSTAAQGDFARTSDQLANSTKIMWAQFADFRTELGVHLLPIALKVVTVLNGMMERFNELSPVTQKYIAYGVALTAVLGTLGSGFLFLVAMVPSVVSGFGAIGIAISFVGAPILAIIAGLGLLVLAFQKDFLKIRTVTLFFLNGILSIVELFKMHFGNAWKILMDNIVAMTEAIGSVVENIFKGIFNWIITRINELVRSLTMVMRALPGQGNFFLMKEIPMLAEGGIVTSPTLAMIGEGGQSEAVIPLDRLGDFGGGGVNIIINDSLVADEEAARDMMERAFSSMNLAT